jgi:hypothetical protein
VLRRFWFTFELPKEPSILYFGCGITAYDLADARRFLERNVFPTAGELKVKGVTEDIDIATLETNHVRPNMGNPVVRGVWYPLGLDWPEVSR